jgi:hypothetical protein
MRIQTPNGKILEVPDNYSHEQIGSVVDDFMSRQQQTQNTTTTNQPQSFQSKEDVQQFLQGKQAKAMNNPYIQAPLKAVKNIAQGVTGTLVDPLYMAGESAMAIGKNIAQGNPALSGYNPSQTPSQQIGKFFDTASGGMTKQNGIEQMAGEFAGSGLAGLPLKGATTAGKVLPKIGEFLTPKNITELTGLATAGATAGGIQEGKILQNSGTATKILAPLIAGALPSVGVASAKAIAKPVLDPTKLLSSFNKNENLKTEVIKASKDLGLKLPASAITENNVINFLESRVAQSNLSGQAYKTLIKNVSSDFVDQYKNTLDSVSPKSFVDKIEGGQQIQQSINPRMTKAQMDSSEAYNVISKHYSDTVPLFDKAKGNTLDSVLERLGNVDELTNPNKKQIIQSVEKIKNRIQGLPEQAPPIDEKLYNDLTNTNKHLDVIDNQLGNNEIQLLRVSEEIKNQYGKDPNTLIQEKLQYEDGLKNLNTAKKQIQNLSRGKRLSDFIIKQGGIKQKQEANTKSGFKNTVGIGDLRAGDVNNKTRVGLFNAQSNKTLDHYREALVERGLLDNNATLDDVGRLLEQDLSGDYVYIGNNADETLSLNNDLKMQRDQLNNERDYLINELGKYDNKTNNLLQSYQQQESGYKNIFSKRDELMARKEKLQQDITNLPIAGTEQSAKELTIPETLQLMKDLGESGKYGDVNAGLNRILRPVRAYLKEGLEAYGKQDKTFEAMYKNALDKANFNRETFRNEFIKSLLKQETPDKLLDMIRKPSDVDMLTNAIGKEGKEVVQSIKRMKLEEILSKNFSVDSSGELTPTYGQFASTLAEKQQLQNNNLLIRKLAGEENYAKLQKLRTVAKAMAERTDIYNKSNSTNVALDTGYFVATATQIFTNPLIAGGMAITPFALSKVITSPKLIDNLTKGMYAQKNNNTALSSKYRNEFVQELARLNIPIQTKVQQNSSQNQNNQNQSY